MVKDGVVVVDVGINRVGDKLVGDVDFDSVFRKASFLTPVPGGVGPVTVAMLLRNTLRAFERSLQAGPCA
jgi:methylenetetrahydrofolate dehydrogenase (NADP+)/methenyltetrahydrofolate cyclohydrolase